MARWWQYGLVALVVVAALSVGVHSAVNTPVDGTECARAQLSVYEDDLDSAQTVTYAALSDRERTAFDRARGRDNRTAYVDPDLFAGFPDGVVLDGTTYRIAGHYVDCPLVSGTPRWLDPVWIAFLSIYIAFSDLYLPGAVAIVVVLGYRKVDDWLQF